MDIAEKFCPVCKNKSGPGAIICRHCGALLEKDLTDSPTTSRSTETDTNVTEKFEELHIDETVLPVGEIAVYVAGTSNPVLLSSEQEFVIGRKVEDTSQPLLDLSKLGGYLLGLSRRHALIRRTDFGYEVIDLSSTNGTWLNAERLIPNKPYPLPSGSQLRLGRMRFFVLYHPVLEPKQKT